MNQLMKGIIVSIFSIAATYTAQANESHHNMHTETSHTQSVMSEPVKEPLYKTTGVIKAIDSKQQKISVSHEAIPEISWPPMTMNFIFTPVAETVGTLKPGQVIDFSFSQQGKDYILQSISVK